MSGTTFSVNRWLKAALTGAALLLFIAAVWSCTDFCRHQFARDVRELMRDVSDDEFYTLNVALHFSTGSGVTFDGESLTTGFHPLYFLVLSALHRLTHPSNETFFWQSLRLKFGLYFAAAGCFLLIAWTACRSKWFAYLLGMIWGAAMLLQPYLQYLALSGLEQLMAVVFFLLLLIWLVDVTRHAGRESSVYWCMGGLLLALTFLSRTDTVVLVPLVGLYFFWQRLASPRPRSAGPLASLLDWTFLRRMLLFFGTAGIAVTVWFVFIYAETGTLVQNSGAVKMWRAGYYRLTLAQHLAVAISFQYRPWWSFISREIVVLVPLLLVLPGMVLWAVASNGSRERNQPRDPSRSLWPLALLCVAYPILLGLAYGWITNSPRPWYFGSPIVALFASSLLAAISVLDQDRMPAVRAAPAVMMGCAVAWLYLVHPTPNRHLNNARHQIEMYDASIWMRTHLPEGARVGAWNSGIYGFFSGHTVINLDGLINNEILPVLLNGTLSEYILSKRLHYLVDYEVILRRNQEQLSAEWMAANTHLEQDLPGAWEGSDGIRVLRVLAGPPATPDQRH